MIAQACNFFLNILGNRAKGKEALQSIQLKNGIVESKRRS